MRLFKVFTSFLLMMGIFVVAGCSKENQTAQPVNGNNGQYEETVTLYFSDADANYLVADQREVQVENTDCVTLAQAVVKELIAGPEEDSGLFGIMPPDTELQTVALSSDGVLEVSFNQAFVDEQSGGSAGMILTLYGLVNSLTCLDGVESVQILIDGQATEAYQGLISPSEPVVPMMEYVQPAAN